MYLRASQQLPLSPQDGTQDGTHPQAETCSRGIKEQPVTTKTILLRTWQAGSERYGETLLFCSVFV